ncbi:MAG TPA: FtsX-like permease family protein [Ktedonobacterales bacterium]|nr:FtsX-like permease family protein [Ktedonobacterales bacterium]
MAQATQTPPRPQSRTALPSIMTLALWRVRRTWGLLLLAGIGILAAVTLVCTVPLYSEVAMTAGLRGVLDATPQSSELTLQVNLDTLTPSIVDAEYQSLNSIMQQQLGSYLQKKTDFFMETPLLNIATPKPDDQESMLLYGAPMQEAAQHIKLARGRLPAPLSNTLEIALTERNAHFLGVDVGSKMTVDLYFFGPGNPLVIAEPVQVVGIIVSNPSDPFWHGEDFDPPPTAVKPPPTYTALMSNDTFLAQLQQIANGRKIPGGIPFTFGEAPTLSWYYHFNVSAIGINQLDDLLARLQTVQGQIDSGNTTGPQAGPEVTGQPRLSGSALDSAQGAGTLSHLRSRISVVNIPVTLLLFQVVGLILFFVSLMAGLLVERQADVISVLRSRGASRRQIFGSFVTQSFGLALLAFIVGPLLAILAARLLVQATLSPSDQEALNVIGGNLAPVALTVGWYALVAALCAVVAMVLAVRGSASRDVLEMRRESARTTRLPFWQRIYLDVVAVIIALTGFAFWLYVSNSGALDAQTSLVISTPLALVAPIFLVIAGILLFLRFFPVLLRLLSSFASRRPEAAPMLALAQMARAPRQAVRMILLLALASSFASFALVFITSEAQHLQTIAAYETGADFSGNPLILDYADPLAKQTAAYRAIPGVTSATLGFADDALEPTTAMTVSVRAVDASTFAQTAIWTTQDSTQPLSSLLHQLITHRPPAKEGESVPAVIDALAWQKLNLTVGAHFTLQLDNKLITFTALAEIEHIPTVNDSLVSGSSSDFTPPGGILTDYQSLISVFNASSGDFLTANYVWLRTSDDPALLAKTRADLTKGPLALSTLNDRRANLNALEQDPLYLALLDVLILGTITTILLALIGNLIASWLSARARLINFAVLRALGTAPSQLAGVLTWEQVVIYTTAIALGAVFGALLAATIVPALVFTGVTSYTADTTSGLFYTLQHILPIQVVVPGLLVVVFAALVVICAGAIWMMARVASRPSISQTLRLNAD